MAAPVGAWQFRTVHSTSVRLAALTRIAPAAWPLSVVRARRALPRTMASARSTTGTTRRRCAPPLLELATATSRLHSESLNSLPSIDPQTTEQAHVGDVHARRTVPGRDQERLFGEGRAQRRASVADKPYL
eukprot:2951759-Prymnesium_polylepis.1